MLVTQQEKMRALPAQLYAAKTLCCFLISLDEDHLILLFERDCSRVSWATTAHHQCYTPKWRTSPSSFSFESLTHIPPSTSPQYFAASW
jgi:hypothetical protein